MSVEIKIPSVGESISTVVVGDWLVKPGQSVARETVLVVLETDKINVEVVAPEDGSLIRVLRQSGETVGIGEVLAELSAWAEPCSKNAQWFHEGEFRRMQHERHPGWSRAYAWVREPGRIRAGDPVVVEP